MNLQDIRAIAEALARRAGDALMAHWVGPLQEVTKANIYDIVTQGDKDAEAVIVAGLREAFPDHHIVSEEGGGTDLSRGDADHYWFIDPIDGTTNFAHKLPYFSVSIALASRDRSPLVGVVLNPVSGEVFSAARGMGATLNQEPIHVTATSSLDHCLLSTGFATDKQRALENLPYFQTVLMRARDVRRFGSAALDLCYVAAGRLDGYWETGLQSWDALAGVLVVEEAGGRVSDLGGGQARLYTGQEVVATNGHVHEELLHILSSAFQP